MKLEVFKEKRKEILIGVGVVGFIVFSLISNSASFNKETEKEDLMLNYNEDTYEETEVKKNQIYIHLDGAVENRGLIELEEGDRLENAIIKAGGLLDSADLRYVNLASILVDGEKIYIPTKEEVLDTGLNATYIPLIQESKRISINNANIEKLQEIPGVGPSTANNIVNYREKNGKFKKIEDIKNVTGIGDAKFEAMFEYIEI